MRIVKLGKELTLRRLFYDYFSPGVTGKSFSGLNYFIFGTRYMETNNNDNASGLINARLAAPISTPVFVTSPYYGIKFSTAFNENSVPPAYSGTYNEVGLAYIHGYNGILLSGNPGQLDSGYTLFFYGRIHDMVVSPGLGGTYSVSITIYYP